MNRRAWLVAATAFGLAGCDARRAESTARVPVLRGLDSATAPPERWRGRVLVANVWASWCAPCRAEMASLQALSERLDPARAVVIGVSVDEDVNLVREYLRGGAVRFEIFVAAAALTREAMGVQALPETLVWNADGTLRQRIRGARDWTEMSLLVQLDMPLRAAAGAGA